MDIILSRLPSQKDLLCAAHGHRGKISGFLAGTLGTYIVTVFLVVVFTGVPHGGERVDPNRTVVYPNF